MARPDLADALGHHVWATLRVIDLCLTLNPEQLGTAVPGTYGSILATTRHIVGADAWDLYVFTGDRSDLVDEDAMDLAQLDHLEGERDGSPLFHLRRRPVPDGREPARLLG